MFPLLFALSLPLTTLFFVFRTQWYELLVMLATRRSNTLTYEEELLLANQFQPDLYFSQASTIGICNVTDYDYDTSFHLSLEKCLKDFWD